MPMRRCQSATLWAAGLLSIWLGVCQAALGLSTPAEKRAPQLSCDAVRIPARETAAEQTPKANHARFLAFQGKLNSLEERLFADAANGRLHEHSLLDAALVASGVEKVETLRHYQQQWAALVAELRRCGASSGSPRQQAEMIFDFMHRRILRAGYRIESTDLRLALEHGWFNCVSASVLFNGLAEELGLPVRGLETPCHVQSRLFLPEGALDMETTCPRWFSLIGDPSKEDEQLQQTLGQASAEDRGRVREVSDVEMVAMIYYNRGIDLLAEKQFADAAAANAKALRLDPSSTTAKGNLLATVNNWAIALGTAEHYVEAASLLKQGMAIDASFETFLLNYVHVCHQWSQDLCADGRFAEALDLLAKAAAEHPDQPYFRRAPAEIYRRWAHALFAPGKPGQLAQPMVAGPYPHHSGKRLADGVSQPVDRGKVALGASAR